VHSEAVRRGLDGDPFTVNMLTSFYYMIVLGGSYSMKLVAVYGALFP
jgi:hypothetical protein